MRTLARWPLILWGLPNTALGALAAALALATGARGTLRRGVLEVHGGAFARLLAALPIGARSGTAMTLGRVVLATCAATLDATRAHERVHVAQSERWGPLFLPAYAAASLAARLRGRDPYRANRFEREAFIARG